MEWRGFKCSKNGIKVGPLEGFGTLKHGTLMTKHMEEHRKLPRGSGISIQMGPSTYKPKPYKNHESDRVMSGTLMIKRGICFKRIWTERGMKAWERGFNQRMDIGTSKQHALQMRPRHVEKAVESR